MRILHVTDPCDRVFSLLGHPQAVLNGEIVAKPDYTVSRGVVYTRFATTFIKATKRLYILTLVDHESDQSISHLRWDTSDDTRMPSWVPDWHSTGRPTPLPYPIAPTAKEDAKIRIVGSPDSVTRQLMPRLHARGWVVDQVVAVSHRMETTDFPVTNLFRERAKKNPFFLDRLWEMVQGSNAKDPIKVLDNLSLALADGLRDNNGLNLVEGVNHSAKDATRPGKAQDVHRQTFAAYILEYHRLHKTARAAKPAAPFSNDYLPPRSLYSSLPDSAQAEIHRRAAGASSLTFVQDITWVSMCRVVFRTATGLIGMGPRVMRPNDVVCRVRRCPVLMVLREAVSDDEPYDVESSASGEAERDIACEMEGDILCEPEGHTANTLHYMHVGPSIIPERMVSGSEFDEVEREFVIC